MSTSPNLASLEPLGKFRTDLVIEPQKKDGAGGAYRVLDPVSNVSHVFTELEYAVATCMNGERNALEVARHAARLGHPVQADHVERFHRELEGMSFVFRDQPLTLTRAPDTSHRDDARRFVEEAKRELALGRVEIARDLLDAALAIDRVAASGAATGGSQTQAVATPAPNEMLAPVLDYLKDWNVPLPHVDDGAGAPTVPIAKRRGPPPWLAAVAAALAVVAGVGAAAELTRWPDDLLSFSTALAEAPVTPVAPVAPVAPVVAPPPPLLPPATALAAVPVEDQAVPPSDTDVVAPAKGKFMRALVQSGLKVKAGQRIAIVAQANGKQSVVTAPVAGIFEAKVPLGKVVDRGGVVGVVHGW